MLQTSPNSETMAANGQTWQWRNQSIYYVRVGEPDSQRPPLLLVHGFGASTDHWRHNLAGLQSDLEVWAIDLLGFGRSAKPDWDYCGELWRDQLSDFIAGVIGRPVVLAGNSLGGYVSLCVAAQKPELAVGLILLNSAGPFTETEPVPAPPWWQRAIKTTTQTLFRQEWVSFLLFQYLRRPAIIRKTLKKVYFDQTAVTDQLVADIYRPSCDPGAPKVFASVFKSRKGAKVDELLQQLTCPLLLLWGVADPWITYAQRSAKFRQYYPHLTEYQLQAGHCPHDEIPEKVNDLMRQWILSI